MVLYYPCYHCNREFSDITKYKKHCSTDRHKNNDERLSKLFKLNGTCPNCDYKTDNIFVLEKHLTTHKELKCVTCNIVFNKKDDLNNHLTEINHFVALRNTLLS